LERTGTVAGVPAVRHLPPASPTHANGHQKPLAIGVVATDAAVAVAKVVADAVEAVVQPVMTVTANLASRECPVTHITQSI
jgi:hypothetical protein